MKPNKHIAYTVSVTVEGDEFARDAWHFKDANQAHIKYDDVYEEVYRESEDTGKTMYLQMGEQNTLFGTIIWKRQHTFWQADMEERA